MSQNRTVSSNYTSPVFGSVNTEKKSENYDSRSLAESRFFTWVSSIDRCRSELEYLGLRQEANACQTLINHFVKERWYLISKIAEIYDQQYNQ